MGGRSTAASAKIKESFVFFLMLSSTVCMNTSSSAELPKGDLVGGGAAGGGQLQDNFSF